MDGNRQDAKAALEPYQLHGVRETGTELGRGSFAAVVEVDYKGMRCAGKKIHPILSQPGEGDRLVGRFEEECRLLGALRHPHVVQFLGIFFDHETDLPVLVMEFLPVTLTQCLDRYGLLPEEVNYAILRDVALGLRYLHEQRPPIIHRDLSANNVLLTGDMTAKISDLGVAKILRLSPAQMSRMTRAPGTNSYMPPEALRPDPHYDVTVDVFSFGVMMVHVLSSQWPLPSEATQVDRHNKTRVIGSSEVERRAEYLDTIGRGHPLMQLIEECLSNSPDLRPSASDLVERMSGATAQHPLTFSNRVEMMRRITSNEREKEELQTRVGELERDMVGLKSDIERQQAAESVEMEQLQLEVAELKAEKTHLTTSASAREQLHQAQLEEKNHQCHSELEEKEELYNKELKKKNRLHQAEVREKEELLQKEKKLHQTDIQQLRAQLGKAHQHHQAESEEKYQLYQTHLQSLQALHEQKTQELQSSHSTQLHSKETQLHNKDVQLQIKEAQLQAKDVELSSQSTLLSQKETTIKGLSSRLQQVKDNLTKNTQVHLLSPQAKLVWKECAPMPVKMHSAQATVISGKVYVGGGHAERREEEFLICKYDAVKNEWSTLPPAPVRRFGIGQLNGKLVLVGGRLERGTRTRSNSLDQQIPSLDDVNEGVLTGNVHVFEDSLQWEKPIPALPVPCCDATLLCLDSSLVVCDGKTNWHCLEEVYVYNSHTSQWSSAEPQPVLHGQSYAIINNSCFLRKNEKSVVSISLPSHSLLQELPDIPYSNSSLATIGGSTLTIGGSPGLEFTSLFKGYSPSKIHVYCPTASSWIQIGSLPAEAPQTRIATASLPSGEVLVMGGKTKNTPSDAVFMGSIETTA